MGRIASQRFLLCLHCLVLLLRVARGVSYTYARRPGTYVEYDRWRTTQDGLATFNFKTSQADALLFYLDSSGNGGNFLAVWLEDGVMNARIKVGSGSAAPLLETTFGDHLNDLSQHSLLIKHSRGTFEFYLDDAKAGELRYNVKHLFQTRSQVYIGGLPASYEPDYESASQLQPLAGCIDGVRFADASPNIIELRSRDPSATNGVQEGCSDGCADAQCNGGRCVRNWSRPDGFFCDCSAADNVGEFCTDPSPEHLLTLFGSDYACYTITPEPFTPSHDDIIVQLQSPLPPSGTILTGRSKNTSDWFHLFLDEHTLHYELTIGRRAFPSTKSTNQLSSSQNYRIHVTRSESEVVIVIETVSSTNQIAVAETIELSLPSGTSEPVFPFVSVGGGALETPLYNGVMERIFIGHTAAVESQTSTRRTPSELINFRDNPPSPSLEFTKHGLRSDAFSFQFRLGPETSTGVILKAGNSLFDLTLTIFNSFESNEIFLVAGFPVSCDNVNVVDNHWHLLELRKTERGGSRGIVVTFDKNSSTSCQIDISRENFDILESNTSILELGPTTSSAIFPGNPTPFVGCFQKIRFTTGSDVFAPNLEVPIMQHERFHGDGCRDCDPEYEKRSCKRSNGVCHNRGFNDITCDCLEPYLGSTCECLGNSIGPPNKNCTDVATPPPVISSSPSPSSVPSTPLTTPTEMDPSLSGNTGNKNSSGIDYDALGQWVGIGTAILLILVLLSIMMVFMGCFIHSQRIKRVGFYRTHENTPSVSLPHFSASLKTAHSHTLNLEQNRVTAITNGRTVHPTYSSGEKEFYI